MSDKQLFCRWLTICQTDTMAFHLTCGRLRSLSAGPTLAKLQHWPRTTSTGRLSFSAPSPTLSWHPCGSCWPCSTQSMEHMPLASPCSRYDPLGDSRRFGMRLLLHRTEITRLMMINPSPSGQASMEEKLTPLQAGFQSSLMWNLLTSMLLSAPHTFSHEHGTQMGKFSMVIIIDRNSFLCCLK